MDLMKNVMNNVINFRRNNTDSALDIQAKNKMVNYHASEVSSQNTKYHCFGVITQRR